MYEFVDLSSRTHAATVAIGAWLVTDVSSSLGLMLAGNDQTSSFYFVVALLALINFVMFIVSVIFVARWIHRASANAHAIDPSMTISPGWAVGWFFIPFANLIKPYEAMRETWSASMGERGGYSDRDTGLVKTWWGLWIAMNIVSWAAFRAESLGASGTVVGGINLVASALAIAVSYTLVSIMRQVRDAQPTAGVEQVFA